MQYLWWKNCFPRSFPPLHLLLLLLFPPTLFPSFRLYLRFHLLSRLVKLSRSITKPLILIPLFIYQTLNFIIPQQYKTSNLKHAKLQTQEFKWRICISAPLPLTTTLSLFSFPFPFPITFVSPLFSHPKSDSFLLPTSSFFFNF